jgi:hypothetical protein
MDLCRIKRLPRQKIFVVQNLLSSYQFIRTDRTYETVCNDCVVNNSDKISLRVKTLNVPNLVRPWVQKCKPANM